MKFNILDFFTKKKKRNSKGEVDAGEFVKKHGLKGSARKMGLVFLIVAASVTVIVAIFFILALALDNDVFTLISAILFVLFIAFTVVSVYLLFKQSYIVFFNNLMTNTRDNYAKLASFEQGLTHYGQDEIDEFKELNDQVDQINSFLSNVMLANSHLDYDNLDLDYPVPGNKKYITLDSFLKNYKQFILQTELFRNAIIFFYYDAKPEFMTEDVYTILYKNILAEFDEDNIVIARHDKRMGFMVYLPYIDSLSCLKERLEKVVRKSVLAKHEAGGANVAVCKCACVVYPYSDIEDLIPDLRYAIRQGKDVNLYTPDRLNRANKHIYHTSLNLNNIAKMFESLSKGTRDFDDLSRSKSAYQKVLKQLADHVGFETVGAALYNSNKRQYVIDFEFDSTERGGLFKDEINMDRELIEELVKCCDDDSSFYFSKRLPVNNQVGRKLDIYGIKSGYFFLVREDDIVKSVIYYLNRDKEQILLNAYDKESLMVFSAYAAEFTRQISGETDIHVIERRYRSILRLTDYNLYSIDRNNHELIELSDGLQDVFGVVERGDKCYRKLYGLDEPCRDCPLTAKTKKVSHIGQRDYITSMMLERKKEEYPTILLSPVNEDSSSQTLNRYDPHLLIHSTYGFIERLDNLFLSKNRGYILFVSIDNSHDLLELYGEEGYQSRLRAFFKNYRHNHKFGEGEVYAYRDNIFAFVFPEEGRVDILNKSESIYEISQRPFDENDKSEVKLKCTYIGFEYPQTFNNRVEFTRNVDKYIKDNDDKFHKDLFILPDTNYIRMASREQFIVSLLDNALQTESLSLKYLPEVKGSANKIVGAELLLRLTDKYRNVSLSPYEFIPVASKNNRIGSITNYLINRIGEMYQKYGLSAFKLAGLKSLSLNIDTTYFDDPNFLDKIAELVEKYHFPRGFLRFEFNEFDVAEHYDEIKQAAQKITNLDVYITADNYTGRYVSINKLKELGFFNIKLSRSLIVDMVKDPTKISGVKSIVDSIKEFGLNYCFVGIEDKQTFQMLSEIDQDFIAEGYYFYQPLDLDVLLDKLRQTIM